MQVIESHIDEVKVYHRGATVTRALTLDAADGVLPERIEIPELPLSLADGSVRLLVRAAEGGGELIAAELRVGLYARPEDELPREPDREALKAAERALALQQDRLAQLEQETLLLRSIPIPPRPEGRDGEPPPPSPLAARVAMEQLIDRAVRARQEEARSLREAMRATRETLEDLRAQLRRFSRAQTADAARVTKTVVATLRRSGPVTRAELRLEYFVPGCRWAPRYQCRVARDGTRATLSTRALVVQDTGEDWSGVRLVLSTAAPLRWTELPALGAIRIGRAQAAPVRRGFRAPPRGAEALLDDWIRDSQKLSPPRRLPQEPSLQTGISAPRLPELGPVSAAAYELSGFGAGGAAPMEEVAGEPEPAMCEAPAARPAPRMKQRAARPAAPPSRSGRAGPRSDEAGDEAGAAAPPRFSLLRLGGPEVRGRLQPADPGESYRELLERSGLAIPFDPAALVQRATARAAAVERLPLPTGAVDVRRAAASFDYAYRTAARVDVPSDGAFHSVPVDSREAPCTLRYVAVPREDTSVFREAAVENPSAAPLLPGAAEIYVGGEYVVTTSLPAVAPRARFRLGLGVEQAIKCARNTRFRESRSGEAVVATAELWHELEIRLVNGLSRPVICEVRERIPQPAEGAEVVVEEGEVSPPWAAYDQEERGAPLLGGRRWEVELAAGAEEVLRASYVIKIYANNEVVGGNRREA